MKLITETIEDIDILTEANAKGGKDYKIRGVFMQADIKNRNGRVYPVGTLQTEVARYTKEFIDKKRAFGELGHPDGPTVNLERVSHMITSLKPEGKNFIGEAKIMDTPYGKIVKNLIDEGAQLGVSSRGMGSISNGTVGKDFYLATAADIVADPSAPDAFEVLKSDDLLARVKVNSTGIPDKIGSYPLNDPAGYYYGFAGAGYGIMWNERYLKNNGLEPKNSSL